MAAALLVLGVAAGTVAGCGAPARPAAVGSVKPCATLNLAVNPGVGYEADVAVVSYLARTQLGCTVNLHQLTEQASWQALAAGTVDAILENWGHDDLKKKYIDDQRVAVEDGVTGNKGAIGWYVPPWLATAHPDVLDWRNLNSYADKFAAVAPSRTSGRSGSTGSSGSKSSKGPTGPTVKGRLLDGDPAHPTNDAALVKNLGLNFSVEYAGSEAALVEAFRTAEAHRTWMIGYFYQPQWLFTELPLVRVTLPRYTPGCDADPARVACDYPPYDLDKIVSRRFAESGSPATTLIRNFTWTNADQEAVAADLIRAKASDDDAAKRWVAGHRGTWASWLSAG